MVISRISNRILPLPLSLNVSHPLSGPVFTNPDNRKVSIKTDQINELNDIIMQYEQRLGFNEGFLHPTDMIN